MVSQIDEKGDGVESATTQSVYGGEGVGYEFERGNGCIFSSNDQAQIDSGDFWPLLEGFDGLKGPKNVTLAILRARWPPAQEIESRRKLYSQGRLESC